MAVGSGDIRRAIVALWDSAGLDAGFEAIWKPDKVGEYSVLLAEVGAPTQPLPYCLLLFREPVKSILMSYSPNLREAREIQISFRVMSREPPIQIDRETGQIIENDDTAATIAADLIESIMAVYGGHPTTSPQVPQLENGGVLHLEYMGDAIRFQNIGDEEGGLPWELNYTVKVDVPVV